jgi:uncharacterized membrane protein
VSAVPTSRLEAFSDGVLAIIITVMVLELKVPHGKDIAALWHTTGTALLTYLLSFVYVGIYWNNHHHMFQLTSRVTGGVLWANLGLLFSLSLFPFTTSWADDTGYARTPTVVYGVNLLLAGAAYYILQTVIIRSQGAGSPLRNALGRDFKGKLSLVVYCAGIISALLSGDGTGSVQPGIWAAIACFISVAIMWVIPDRRIDRAIRDHGAPDLRWHLKLARPSGHIRRYFPHARTASGKGRPTAASHRTRDTMRHICHESQAPDQATASMFGTRPLQRETAVEALRRGARDLPRYARKVRFWN